MRSPTVVLGFVMLCACTDGGPEGEHLVVTEPPPTIEAHAGFEHQPAQVQVVDPDSQPRLTLIAQPRGLDDGRCEFAVEQHGFPAITEDRATIVNAYTFGSSEHDYQERLQVTWLAADATRVDEVYVHSAPDDERECVGVIKAVKARVAAANLELAEHVWRPLERLDAYYSEPGFLHKMTELGVEDEVIDAMAGPDRPIEVFYRNGHLIARVRQLQVLQDTLRMDWRDPNEFCATDAQVHSIEFDRASKAALVRYNHNNGGCLCDDRETVARIELSDELLAATEVRSTAAFTMLTREWLASDN